MNIACPALIGVTNWSRTHNLAGAQALRVLSLGYCVVRLSDSCVEKRSCAAVTKKAALPATALQERALGFRYGP